MWYFVFIMKSFKFSVYRGGSHQTLRAVLPILILMVGDILSVVATDLSRASAPQISAGPRWSDHNVTTNTVFRFVVDIPYCGIHVRCDAKYPIEWVYEYTKDHTHLYEEKSLQWVSTSRSYNPLDFRNANLFTYQSSIRFSCNHNFAEKKILNCRSVSEPSKKTVIEGQYVTPEVARSFKIIGPERTTTLATFKYLLLRLITNEGPAGTEDTESTETKDIANCTAVFSFREVNGGRDPPAWKCANENGTTGAIEFRYCRTGMACANLFRNVGNLCAVEVNKIEDHQNCEGCISARSFEPGMVYCSIEGELIGAQQFFYSFRKAEIQVNNNGAELLTNSNYNLPLFNLVFSWDEVAPEDMIFAVPFNQTLYAGESVMVTCYFSELFFLSPQIRVVYRDGNVRFVHASDASTVYDQKSNAIRALVHISTRATLSTPDFEYAQCWGAVWNTTEWIHVNTTKTDDITLTVPVKPHFENGTEYIELYAGDPIRLSCLDPAAVPTPWYFWSFNYTIILPTPSGPMTHYSGLKHFYSELYTFKSPRAGHHKGIYKCTASNPAGSSTKIFMVSVQLDPMPKILNTGGARILYEGESQVSLNCTAKGRPPLTYSWARSENQMKNQAGLNAPHELGGNSSILQFNPVKKTDSGLYYCAVSNKDGDKKIQFDVTVKEPISPKFVISDETFYIYPGSPSVIDKSVSSTQACKLEAGDPTPTVQFLTPEHRNVSSIAILDRTSPGDYICIASNKFGTSSKTVRIIAKDGVSPRFDSDTQVIAIEWGSINKSITCDVQGGDPLPSVSWAKKSNIPVSHGNLTLKFDFVTTADEGKYICEARNWAGTARKLFVVTVQQKSNLPTELRDDSSNNGLRITLFIVLVIVSGFAILMIYWKLKLVSGLAQSKLEEHQIPNSKQFPAEQTHNGESLF